MSQTTVFIILDAARTDYLDPDQMPFLHGLSQDALTGAVESPPGFAQRTVLFSGRYPDTSGNFSAFAYDPDQSPFGWVEHLGPLRGLIRPRKVMYPARLAIDTITGWLTDAYHTDPAWIPPRFLPSFRPCEDMQPIDAPGALGASSLFDLCRQDGLSYRYIGHPISGDDDKVCQVLTRELRDDPDEDVFIAQFSATDEEAHHHGPHSDHVRQQVLPELDAKLASIHAALTAGSGTWDLFILGDHGMAPVEQRVDVLGYLDDLDVEPGKDYVAFVNSTLTVFWYLSPAGMDAIEGILPEIPGTYPLDEEDRHELRIPTEERWGHSMLAAEPGVLFWPDYFHVTDSTIRGMHGYLDKQTEGLGLCVLASNRAEIPTKHVGACPLVDVFPTLLDLLELPHPSTNEGTSLLQRPDQTEPGPGQDTPVLPATGRPNPA